MNDERNYYLDITTELCPMTFVRTKLLVERMAPGQTAQVRLKGSEPLANVPRSVAELGHEIVSLAAEPGEAVDGVHLLVIRRR
jgi:TusA-related sulfurtransferase